MLLSDLVVLNSKPFQFITLKVKCIANGRRTMWIWGETGKALYAFLLAGDAEVSQLWCTSTRNTVLSEVLSELAAQKVES